jgi:DNA polymerase
MARELGLPGSLEMVGQVIGLPEDKQKSKTGKALIRYFSIPCKPTGVNGGRTRNLPKHDPEKWAIYVEYNRQDVEAERAIRERLQKFPVLASEHDLYVIDQNINDRGVGVDTTLAEHAVEIDHIVKARLLDEAKALTGLDNPKSAQQLKGWIEEVSGYEVESLNKKMIGNVRAGTDNEDVHAMLDIRQGLSKTSTEKYNAMLRTVCPDGRIRGLTQFCGASRTGRWAGRLVQMQNLPQNKIPDKDLDCARQLVRSGDLGTLEMLFDDTAGTLSQLIRTAFIPKKGCRFIVSDFSAIEARVLAWLADETWRMDVFNTHGKIYEASAEQMFHLPPGSVKKGDPMRQKGKIAELALGYGGSVGAMKNMGALEMGLSEDELKPIVNSWRAANKCITKLWWDTDAAVRRCITTKAPVDLPHGMRLRKQGPLLRLRLPNGRELSYVKPRIDEDDNITYEGTIQASGGWGRIESYGPKIVENIVQATARDCLAEAMFRLEAAGFPIVFHVHDEVICEVPIGVSSDKELGELMGQPIPWAKGLPLRADAYECEYYRKD